MSIIFIFCLHFKSSIFNIKSVISLNENKIIADLAKLSRAQVFDKQGLKISLKSLWEEKTSVLVFLRHFGCQSCREHASQVWNNRQKIEQSGAKIHFIGNGTVNFMNSFVEDMGLQEASNFTDPQLNAFRAAGFRKGFWIDPGEMHSRGEFLWLAINHQLKFGYETGDVWQLGGVLVVSTGGRVTYQYTCQIMGKFPPVDDIKTL